MYEMSQRHPVWVTENHVNPCNSALRDSFLSLLAILPVLTLTGTADIYRQSAIYPFLDDSVVQTGGNQGRDTSVREKFIQRT